MKRIAQYLITATAAVFAFSSCEKKLEEAYANPNSFSRVPVETLLPPVIYSMALDPQTDFRFLGGYIQNWTNISAQNQWDRMGYQAGSDNGGAIWRGHYYDLGQNLVKMVEWGSEERKWDYVGVAKAIQAWSWLLTTDYHGEIILKEAFNTNLLTFKYDTQEEVYNYVRQLCREAIENLEKTGDGVSPANLQKGDAFMNNGDVEKWKKFVYGVMARSYNHLSNKSIYKADSVIFYCDKAMQSSADDVTVKFSNAGRNNEANFFSPFRGNMAAYRQTEFTVNLLTGTNAAFPGVDDPRKWYYLQLDANNTTFRGLQIAKGEAPITANSRPRNFWGNTSASSIPPNDLNSKYLFRNNSEFPVMTATEIHFMKAEAALRKGDKTTALGAYKRGIEESFNMLLNRFNQNVPTANQLNSGSAATFMSDVKVVPTNLDSVTLTRIMLQKYIALWGYGMHETWTDLRRFHYIDPDPVTTQQVYRGFTPPSSTAGDLFPDNSTKFVYRVRPRYNSEYIWNVVELDRIGARTADYHTVKCWFSEP
jgi:hypothetical protein